MSEVMNITPQEAEAIITPQKYSYTYEDFLDTEKPYEKLYSFFGNQYLMKKETIKMDKNAKAVGFNNFNSVWKMFLESKEADRKMQLSAFPNQTEFSGLALELSCENWVASDWGVYRLNAYGGREVACAHPIAPVERLVNIDTGEVKLKLAFKRSGHDQKWSTIIVPNNKISSSRQIVDELAPVGISVTSESAKYLVAYLNDVCNANYKTITERKSVGRLGYISDYGFSPYVEDLVFDGDASFRNLYNSVQAKGYFTEWLKIAKECRAQSITAKIMLAASFASPLLSIVGSLPFFVHLWGVDSGTGKTVALMLAASVWGNPAVGSYVQTFNGTQVGQERTAAFLNHLPMCLDELQLTKNSKGQSNFDVYQLAQGVGRSRGKKQGGVEAAPTWSCCFLTTGESPLTTASSGAGAVNRVIDIECTSGTVAIKDGHRVAGILKSNYGNIGEIFISQLYNPEGLEKRLSDIREIYQDFFKELCEGDSTEKQAMAAAAILTADLLASMWIFQDDTCLTVQEISEFLASREAVSAGHRAYDWLCDWVAANENKFRCGEYVPMNDVYGVIENNTAYIIKGVFDRAIQDAGFSTSATLSYLKSNGLIETRKDKGYTKTKRIGKTTPQCVWLRLRTPFEVDEEDMLPL